MTDRSGLPQHAAGRARHASQEHEPQEGREPEIQLGAEPVSEPDAEPIDEIRSTHAGETDRAVDPVDAIVDSAVPPHAPRRAPRGIARRARGLVGRVLLDVLALGGLVCILLVAASFLFKVSIIMFATGSMSPTIPAGSVALVREIPAVEIAVGDVVTVDRSDEGQLPVTHRVIEVVDEVDGVVTFRMQGDDNADPDAEPYVESTVRIVMGSIPGLANVIVWFQNPFVLGGITLGATVLVTWAFWPREQRDDAVAASQHAG